MKKDERYNIPENKEYVLSGTIEEMISILVSDFCIDEDEARFIAYISTIEKQEKVVFEEKDLKLWYLNEETPSTSPIGKLPYTISITKFKLEANHALYIFMGTLVFQREVAITALGLEFIWALKQAIQKISEDEYCVYGRVVDFVYSAKRESFELKDVIPYDKDNECNRRPDTWKCPYWNNDRCSLNESRIKTVLGNLVEKGVLTHTAPYWTMVK